MKLYLTPGACSSPDLISLYEANLPFEAKKVDLATKKTESGADYLNVNAKGYVPALVLGTGETLTENVAILDLIAQQDSALKPSTAMARSRLIEALAYLSAELHGNFLLFFTGAGMTESTLLATRSRSGWDIWPTRWRASSSSTITSALQTTTS